MTVASATARSVNSAYIDMESKLDLCDIAKTAENLGVHLTFAGTSATPVRNRRRCRPACPH